MEKKSAPAPKIEESKIKIEGCDPSFVEALRLTSSAADKLELVSVTFFNKKLRLNDNFVRAAKIIEMMKNHFIVTPTNDKDKYYIIKDSKYINKFIAEHEFATTETTLKTETPVALKQGAELHLNVPNSSPENEAAPGKKEQSTEIAVGSVFSYQGADYRVTEVPSKENKNKYILVHPTGKPIYKITQEELELQFANGNAKLVSPEKEPEAKSGETLHKKDGVFETPDGREFYRNGKLTGLEIKTPNGIEYYDADGVLRRWEFPNGIVELYNEEEKIYSRIFADGSSERFNPENGESLGFTDAEGNKIPTKKETTSTREEALAKLKAIIENAEKELKEIQKELETIKAKDSAEKAFTEKAPETETIQGPETKIFSPEFIREKIVEILKDIDAVKNIKEVRLLTANGVDKISLVIELTAKKRMVTTDIALSGRLINKENSIILEDGYILTSTKAEKKLKGLFAEHVNSIGEKVKEYIENETNKKVAKMEIVNGELKVTFS